MLNKHKFVMCCIDLRKHWWLINAWDHFHDMCCYIFEHFCVGFMVLENPQNFMFLLCLFSKKIQQNPFVYMFMLGASDKVFLQTCLKISQPIYALLPRNLGVGDEVFFIHVWNISGPIYPLSQVLLFISSFLENFGCWWRSFLYTCLCFHQIEVFL